MGKKLKVTTPVKRFGTRLLRPVQVRSIRKKYAKRNHRNGVSYRSLAAEYGVSHNVISNLVRRITYKHIE